MPRIRSFWIREGFVLSGAQNGNGSAENSASGSQSHRGASGGKDGKGRAGSSNGGNGGNGGAAKPPPLGRRKTATALSPSLAANAHAIRMQFHHSGDLRLRLLSSGALPGIQLAALYLQGIVDEEAIRKNVLEPLQAAEAAAPGSLKGKGRLKDRIEQLRLNVISTGLTEPVRTLEGALDALLLGCCLLLVEGSDEAVAAEAAGGETRQVGEPTAQTVIRGPQHAFTESARTNIGLIRRIIRSERLTVESRRIGRETCTEVSLLYMNGIVDAEIVKEARRRLDDIDIDSVLDSGYIEEFIQDSSFTPFPTVLNTERPDQAAAGLLEGHFAVVVDGSPYVLLGPVTFFRFFQSPEDHYQRFDIASFLRLIRIAAFFISMHLPALYIAITTFHQEMLPSNLLIGLSAQREGVPFPALVEAFLMELTFEVLREAGVRMPRAIGPAISIVGALVLGTAAVQAGLVSAAMVIIVAFTAISNFVVPQINIAIAARLIRFLLMVSAGILGFVGIISVDLFVIIHLAGLYSFGVPYLKPVAPYVKGEWKDTFVRAPRWSLVRRPVIAQKGGRRRQPGGKPKRQNS